MSEFFSLNQPRFPQKSTKNRQRIFILCRFHFGLLSLSSYHIRLEIFRKLFFYFNFVNYFHKIKFLFRPGRDYRLCLGGILGFFTANARILKKALIFGRKFGIISTLTFWRDVRAGRRSTIGNRVYGYNRIRGSNPRLSAMSPQAVSRLRRFCFSLGNALATLRIAAALFRRHENFNSTAEIAKIFLCASHIVRESRLLQGGRLFCIKFFPCIFIKT